MVERVVPQLQWLRSPVCQKYEGWPRRGTMYAVWQSVRNTRGCMFSEQTPKVNLQIR